MPGYTMHLAEATMLLPRLKKRYKTDEKWVNRFLLGTLLPDTKIRGDKKESHFWAPEDLDKIARAPKIELFLDKYGKRLPEPCLLGYYAHLYLDSKYVTDFWPDMLAFFDANGREAEKTEEIARVHVARSGENVSVKDFYSVEYYYGDYNRMNGYFFDRYPIQIPVFEDEFDPGIDEVNIQHMHRVLSEMDMLVKSLDQPVPGPVRVFDVEEFDRFIARNAEEFLNSLDE